MGTSEDDASANSAIRHSLFVTNLERWIEGIIAQNGLADKELIHTIKERYQRSIQANIEYHNSMLKTSKEGHDVGMADRHKLMANVYQALLNS